MRPTLVLPNDEAELRAKGYLFADGVRNAFDLEFAPNGELFGTENGPDADYPEELNWLREGHHYGFPWRFGTDENPQQFPGYDPSQDRRLPKDYIAVRMGTYQNDPTFPPPPMAFTDPVANLGPDGDHYRDQDGSRKDAGDLGHPIHTFTPHRSPLGLTFDREGALPEELTGGAFVLSWGDGVGLNDPGQDLFHLRLTKTGDTYQAKVTQIVRGFANPIDAVLLKNRLYVLDYGGAGTIWEVTFEGQPTAVAEERQEGETAFSRPATYTLTQNHPNPFNPETTIRYTLPDVASIRLRIYNLLGQPIRTLVRGIRQPGRYAVVWDGRDETGREVASGVYFYRLEVRDRNFVETKRMILLR